MRKLFTRKVLHGVGFVLAAVMFIGAGIEARPWLIKEPFKKVYGTLMAVAYSAACEAQEGQFKDAFDAWTIEQEAKYMLSKVFFPNLTTTKAGCHVKAVALRHNNIPNTAENALRDCMIANTGSSCTGTVATYKYHALGTTNTAAAETDTACLSEITTAYNPDNQRALGTQTTTVQGNYRTVATNTVDGSAAVVEWCLMNRLSSATVGQGNGVTDTIWSRVVFSVINLASGDSLQTTYDLTIE